MKKSFLKEKNLDGKTAKKNKLVGKFSGIFF